MWIKFCILESSQPNDGFFRTKSLCSCFNVKIKYKLNLLVIHFTVIAVEKRTLKSANLKPHSCNLIRINPRLLLCRGKLNSSAHESDYFFSYDPIFLHCNDRGRCFRRRKISLCLEIVFIFEFTGKRVMCFRTHDGSFCHMIFLRSCDSHRWIFRSKDNTNRSNEG